MRMLGLLLSAVFILGLSACGSDKPTTKSAAPTASAPGKPGKADSESGQRKLAPPQ